MLRRYADRLDYVHFKDIDQGVFDRVLGERIRLFEACGQGVMCPIGRGVIDYPAVKRTLEEIGYHGFITVEQERDPLNVAEQPRRCEAKPRLPQVGRVLEHFRFLRNTETLHLCFAQFRTQNRCALLLELLGKKL